MAAGWGAACGPCAKERASVLLEGLRVDEHWPWAWPLIGTFLGAPAWSSRLLPSPPLGWDVMCQGCDARRQQDPSMPSALVHGVEDAARALRVLLVPSFSVRTPLHPAPQLGPTGVSLHPASPGNARNRQRGH